MQVASVCVNTFFNLFFWAETKPSAELSTSSFASGAGEMYAKRNERRWPDAVNYSHRVQTKVKHRIKLNAEPRIKSWNCFGLHLPNGTDIDTFTTAKENERNNGLCIRYVLCGKATSVHSKACSHFCHSEVCDYKQK